MKKPKIVFMGSSDFAIPALEELNKVYNIPLVITQPDKVAGRGNKKKGVAIKKKAQSLGLELFQPENINDSESLKKIKEINPDLIVVCAYGQLLGKELLNLAAFGCLNIHGSLLPKYRGAAPIQRSILNGENEAGISIILLDEEMDSGPVLAKEEVEIDNLTTYESLNKTLAEIGAKSLLRIIPDYLLGKIKPKNQPEEFSIAEKIDKKEAQINWNEKAVKIVRQINAMDNIPGAYSLIENNRVKLFKPEILQTISEVPGQIVAANTTDGLIISSNDFDILINEIQFPGKKRMKAKDFFRGNKFNINRIEE